MVKDNQAQSDWSDTLGASTPPVTYLYRVRTKDGAGNVSSPSVLDHATIATTLFSSIAQHGAIRGIHVRELRMAVDAVRYAADLGPYTTGWSTSYTVPTGLIYASHFLALRTALNQATQQLINQDVTYTGQAPAQGGKIYAYQVQQIQEGVK